jgi:hypothetical protein
LVAREILGTPGVTRNQLLAELRAKHGSFDDKRLRPALEALGSGLVRRSGPNRSTPMYLNGAELPEAVLAALPEARRERPPIEPGGGAVHSTSLDVEVPPHPPSTVNESTTAPSTAPPHSVIGEQ